MTEKPACTDRKIDDAVTMFDSAKNKVILSIKTEISDRAIMKIRACDTYNGVISSFDERIYDFYIELINYYRRADTLYSAGEELLSTEGMIRLLDGLMSVIKSRISQAEEVMTDKNPIKAEKSQIIKKAEQGVLKLVDEDTFEKKLNECFSAVCEDGEKFKEMIYKISANLKKAVLYCISSLNDIENRRVAYYYFEALKAEKEILTSVIRIQVDALEKQEQTLVEESFVQSILFQLREAYQHIIKNVDYIMNGFLDVEKREESRNMTTDKVDFLDIENIFKTEYSSSKEELEEKLSHIVILCRKRVWEEKVLPIKEKFETDFILCENLIRFFKSINAFYEDISYGLEMSGEKVITNGIYETIAIKIESLEDGLKMFRKEYEDIFSSSEEKISQMECFDENIFSLFLQNDKQQAVEEAKELIFEQSERIFSSAVQRAEKQLFNFKKEQLLFELTTFEEIMNYSVSRLRGSESNVIREFVGAIDYGVDEIVHSIEQADICVIRPKPHDMFNGKEHEVLMAEKNADFKKGEIIKVMNSGFKENGRVIIRANVIAAK